jgi:hypothetical protein
VTILDVTFTKRQALGALIGVCVALWLIRAALVVYIVAAS